MNDKRSLRPQGPDFVGVGVQKCGTTWIANILSQHPDADIQKKEISFFVRHYHRGFDWYHKFFDHSTGRLCGEISVNYWNSPRPDSTHKEYYPKWNPRRKLLFWQKQPSARDELKARYPDVKVFVMFRNPVDRAWSHYWFWRNRKERLGKRIVPFERMFEDDGRWLRTQGYYADTLAHWREVFPNIGVFFYDDLVNRPLELAVEVYRFIGVDESFKPELKGKVNAGSYNPMPQALREKVLSEYDGQIHRLAAMTGRDLSHWEKV